MPEVILRESTPGTGRKFYLTDCGQVPIILLTTPLCSSDGRRSSDSSGLLLFMMIGSVKKRAFCYIDGFNLYFGILKKRVREGRWLNVYALMERALRGFGDLSILAVHYYTAHLKERSGDRSSVDRQQVYLRALGTDSRVTIIKGNYQRSKKKRMLSDNSGMVEIWHEEEKKSDVNIAAHLVRDAATDRFDVAVLVSNDSDLVEPVRIAVAEFGKQVFILSPQKTTQKELQKVSSGHRILKAAHIRQSQFPEKLSDNKGQIVKPPEWA